MVREWGWGGPLVDELHQHLPFVDHVKGVSNQPLPWSLCGVPPLMWPFTVSCEPQWAEIRLSPRGVPEKILLGWGGHSGLFRLFSPCPLVAHRPGSIRTRQLADPSTTHGGLYVLAWPVGKGKSKPFSKFMSKTIGTAEHTGPWATTTPTCSTTWSSI